MRACLIAILIAWLGQMAFVLWTLSDFSWQLYWLFRGLYRPGLILFSTLFGGILPGHYFSAFNRTGALAGFTFATLLYAAAIVAAAWLLQRMFLQPPRPRPARSSGR